MNKDYSIISKGVYEHKQTNEFLHINKFIIMRKKAGRYLLLELENLHAEALTGMSFQIDQLDARGNSLGFVNANFNDVSFGTGEFILKEKIKLNASCLEVRIKVLKAEYGNLVYRLGANDTFATIEEKKKKKDINRKAVVKEVGEEGHAHAPRRFRNPVFIGIFSFILIMVCCGAIFLHLKDFSDKNDSFFLSNVKYSFVDGDKSEGSDVYVTGYIGLGGENIVIPSQVNGHPVTKVAENAFKGNKRMETLTVEGDVLIEKSAFSTCIRLKEINLNGVSTVNESAFEKCVSLKEVNAKKLTNLGDYAFANCLSLENVSIEDSNKENVLKLGNSVFAGCGEVESIKIDQFIAYGENPSILSGVVNVNELYLKNFNYKGYDEIENSDKPLYSLFSDGSVNVSVKNVEIGHMDYVPSGFAQGVNDSLQSFTVKHLSKEIIGESAFEGCISLKTFSSDTKVSIIGNNAFKGSAITSFDLTKANALGTSVFEGCLALEKINIARETPLQVIPENTFKDCSVLSQFCVPNIVSSIKEGAFSNSGLTNIDFAEQNIITEIEVSVFEDCKKLTSIKIPSGIVNVKDKAFKGCSLLSSVELPISLEKIGNESFLGCAKLTSIKLPESLLTIGNYAFANCSSMDSIIFPNSVTSLGVGVLTGCNKITSLTIPFVGDLKTNATITRLGHLFTTAKEEGGEVVLVNDNTVVPASLKTVTLSQGLEVPSGAFKDCEHVTTFNLPSTVKQIYSEAFSGCKSLKQITLPSDLMQIYSKAFYNCVNLRSLTLPIKVYSIDVTAFDECYRLFEVTDLCPMDTDALKTRFKYALAIYVSNESALQMPKEQVDGYVFAKAIYKNNEWYLIDHNAKGNITIPDHPSTSVNSFNLPDRYFYEDSSIKSVTISGEVKNIGQNQFAGSTNLEKIVFKDGGSLVIGSYAFKDCEKLKVLDIAGRTVDSSGFIFDHIANSNSIEEIKFPKGITSLSSNWFKNNTKIVSVVLPSSLKTISTYAFAYATALKSVVMPGVQTISDHAFDGCSALESVSSSSATSVKLYAFYNCTKLTTVEIDSVINIGQSAFYNCRSLVSINLPSVQQIGASAFYNCNKLKSFTVFNSLSSIESQAFYNCSSLESINLNSISTLGDYAFYGCSNLKSVTLSNNMTDIPEYAFKNCSSLTSITIPSNITSIKKGAFNGCSQLKTVTFISGSNNLYIADADTNSSGDYVFGGTALTSFDSNGRVYKIGKNAFRGLSSLVSVKLTNVNSVGDYAFYSCYNLATLNTTSVNSIGQYAFYDCDRLTSVSVKGATTIGNYAFYDCGNLETVDLTNTQNINQYAFSDCEKLKNLTIQGVKYIRYRAFANCSELESLELSSSLTSSNAIYSYAFYNCGKLKVVYIPNGGFSNSSTINSSAFGACYNLHEIYNYTGYSLTPGTSSGRFGNLAQYALVVNTSSIAPRLQETTINNIIYKYNSNNAWIVGYSGGYSVDKLNLGDSVTLGGKNFNSYRIAKYAFRNTNINTLYLNSGVSSVDDYAFSSATKVVLHNGNKTNISSLWFSYTEPTCYFRGTQTEFNNKAYSSSLFNGNKVYYYTSCLHSNNNTEWTERNGDIVTTRSYEYQITKNANCTENGSARYYCKHCDHTYSTVTLAKLGHSVPSGEYCCSRSGCDYFKNVTITSSNYNSSAVKEVVNISLDGFTASNNSFTSNRNTSGETSQIVITAQKDMYITITYQLTNSTDNEALNISAGGDFTTINTNGIYTKTFSLSKGQQINILFVVDELPEGVMSTNASAIISNISITSK